MRAVWWLIKLGWRTATRVRDALGPIVEVGTHPTEWSAAAHLDRAEAPPRANLADFAETLEPEERQELEMLTRAYSRTFCGKCQGSPTNPSQRCSDCIALLVAVLKELHGDEPQKIAQIARAAREGRL
jgi:hypothetical protein